MKRNLIIGITLILSACNTPSSNQLKSGQQKEVFSLEKKAQKASIKVIDTDFSKGRLTNEQEITLWDIQKLHGHLCDGLVLGFLGLREGLYQLYPDSVIDRTNTRIVAKSSPCIGDVGVYLSGGRYQFNRFYVDNDIAGMYIVQRIDNGKTITVAAKAGLVPADIKRLGTKAVLNELDACGLDSLKAMEEQFSEQLFSSQPTALFDIIKIENFEWSSILQNDFSKTDILNKTQPNCEIKKN